MPPSISYFALEENMPRGKRILQDDVKTDENEMNQVELLMQEIERLKSQLQGVVGMKADESALPVVEPEEEAIDLTINNTEYIKVVSLCPMKLNIATMTNGQGKVFSFKEFGETKRILYSDLVDVIEHNYGFLEGGLFYILDSRVIRIHGLDDVYANILTKEKLESILAGKAEAVALFKSANDKQKEIIIDLLVRKVRDEQDVDLNMVVQISRLSGKDIISMAETGKQSSEEAKE